MDSKKMDIVMDVKVNVTVQLGTAELPMKEVVELSPGAQIQLKQNAKDPVSLLVNGKLIAHGEVVVIDDKFDRPKPKTRYTYERINNPNDNGNAKTNHEIKLTSIDKLDWMIPEKIRLVGVPIKVAIPPIEAE